MENRILTHLDPKVMWPTVGCLLFFCFCFLVCCVFCWSDKCSKKRGKKNQDPNSDKQPALEMTSFSTPDDHVTMEGPPLPSAPHPVPFPLVPALPGVPPPLPPCSCTGPGYVSASPWLSSGAPRETWSQPSLPSSASRPRPARQIPSSGMAFLSHKDYEEYVDRTSPKKGDGRRRKRDGPWDFVNPVFEEDFPDLDVIPSDDLVEDYMDKEAQRRQREEEEKAERRRGGREREKEARGERRRPEEESRTRWVEFHEKKTRFGDEREDERKKTGFRLREKDLSQEEEAEDEEVVVVMSLEEDDYGENDFYGSRVEAWSPERRRSAESSSSGGARVPSGGPAGSGSRGATDPTSASGGSSRAAAGRRRGGPGREGAAK
nr:zinc finger CCCH domain-containing protein 13-like [Penaeus vannamei]